MSALSGYKTYIVAALIGLATAAKSLGYITPEQYELILGFLGAAGVVTLRAAIAKGG